MSRSIHRPLRHSTLRARTALLRCERFGWGLVAAALLLTAATPALADYTVRGRFLYRDRGFGPTGFTGIDTNRPIRFADVEIVDNTTQAVLAQTATDATGSFTVGVTDAQTRNLRVRVLCRASRTPTLRLRVLRTGDYAVFSVATGTFTNHAPTQDIDFTAAPYVALQGAGGEPFNIWDQGVDAFDFIASRNGSRPSLLLTLYWGVGSSQGTYYRHSDTSILLVGLANDSDGYDDAVILHEIGHYTEFNLADSDNPGGTHSLNGLYDLRLTWSEGQATFFNHLVRSWRGDARPDVYLDTAGQPGPGQILACFDAEAPYLGRPGANNEVTVDALLWDIVDGPSTADATPGVDDDGLVLATGVADFWSVFMQHMPQATSISLEDFWDGWFALGKGNATAMRATFAGRGVEYFNDAIEPDPIGRPRPRVAAGQLLHHTFHGIGDEDWIVVNVKYGSAYVFETLNMLSGADTRLDLFGSHGTTLLASNDDRAPGNVSSRIAWTALYTGTVRLRCKRHTDLHTYGSYDLRISGPTIPVDVTTAPAPGFVLQGAQPNPFNPSTTIAFELPEPGIVSLRIHAADGTLVRALVDRTTMPAGATRMPWNGRDDSGRTVASGVYFIRLETPFGNRSSRAVLLQ